MDSIDPYSFYFNCNILAVPFDAWSMKIDLILSNLFSSIVTEHYLLSLDNWA